MKTIENLQELGFNKNDAIIYIALIEIGVSPAGPIIKKTGLHRNIVYGSLDNLIKSNMVSVSRIRGKKQFRPLSPSVLIREEKQRLELAKETTQELERKWKGEQQEVHVFEGRDGFIQAHYEALENMEKGDTVFVLVSGGESWANTMGEELADFDKKRKKSQIKEKILASVAQEKFFKPFEKLRTHPVEIKYLPKEFDSPSGTAVYKDITLIMVFGEPVFLVMIKNKGISEGYINQFKALWQIAKK